MTLPRSVPKCPVLPKKCIHGGDFVGRPQLVELANGQQGAVRQAIRGRAAWRLADGSHESGDEEDEVLQGFHYFDVGALLKLVFAAEAGVRGQGLRWTEIYGAVAQCFRNLNLEPYEHLALLSFRFLRGGLRYQLMAFR